MKSFKKRIIKRIKLRLNNKKEMRDVIEKEFYDSRGNKIKIKIDFEPHPAEESTMEWQRDYGEENK